MTFESLRRRQNPKRIAAQAAGKARRYETDQAERLSRPYVSLAPVPGELIRRVVVQDACGECVIECRVPTVAARSDQMAVTVDGAPLPDLCGVTALLQVIARRLPRPPSRAMVRQAEISAGYAIQAAKS